MCITSSVNHLCTHSVFLPFFFLLILTQARFFPIDFRKKETEKHQLVVSPTRPDWTSTETRSHTCTRLRPCPHRGLNPQPTYAPTGSWTHNLLVPGRCSNQPGHSGQGPTFLYCWRQQYTVVGSLESGCLDSKFGSTTAW